MPCFRRAWGGGSEIWKLCRNLLLRSIVFILLPVKACVYLCVPCCNPCVYLCLCHAPIRVCVCARARAFCARPSSSKVVLQESVINTCNILLFWSISSGPFLPFLFLFFSPPSLFLFFLCLSFSFVLSLALLFPFFIISSSFSASVDRYVYLVAHLSCGQ